MGNCLKKQNVKSSGIKARKTKAQKRLGFNSVKKRGRISILFFADSQPRVDQIRRRIAAKFNKPLFN